MLKDLPNMTKEFPKTNVSSNEEKLSRIRAKFKQINALLNLDVSAENFDFTPAAPTSSSRHQQANFPNSQTTSTPSNQKSTYHQPKNPQNLQEMSF